MTAKKVLHDNDYFDFQKLEIEVQNAVVSEERYWRENDAKIRAVEQRVPTYDDFREMVLAAHLKPLENKDKISSIGMFTQVWNQSAQKFPLKMGETISKKQDSEQTECSSLEKKSVIKIPKSGSEFVQYWKRHCKTLEKRKQFLFTVGAKEVARIFKTEVGDLLGEILECLQHPEDGEAAQTVELLLAVSETQRFSLSLAFLSKRERESCKFLFDKLKGSSYVKDSTSAQETLTTLESVFCI